MRAFRACVAGGILLCLAASVGLAESFSAEDSFILTETEAIGLLPPVLAAPPQVTLLKFSPDGRFLLTVCRQQRFTRETLRQMLEDNAPAPERQEQTLIQIWDCEKAVSRTVWSDPVKPVQVEECEWLPGSSVALVVVQRLERTRAEDATETMALVYQLLHINAATGKATVLTDLPQFHPRLLNVSPAAPLAVLLGPLPTKEGDKAFLHILTPKADLGKVVFLPDGTKNVAVNWDATGKTPVLITPPREGSAGPVFYRLDPSTAEISRVEKPALYERQPVMTPGLSLSLGEAELAGPKGSPPIKARPALVTASNPARGERPYVVVALDAEQAELSPTLDCVAYVTQGAAFVREIARIPGEVFLRTQQATRMAVITSNGKQAALAIIMYATDNEQRLPSASEFADAIKPYLPDSGKILDSFVYLAPAERLTDIQNPAETRLGYIPTPPEGYVIVFADGHVKWSKTLE